MKAVITGGAGFIGSHLALELIERNMEVIIIDNLSTGNIEHVPAASGFVHLDLSDHDNIDKITEAMQGATYVFHLAAMARVQPSIKNPLTYHKNNVNATIQVLHAAHQAKVKRLIFSSSSSVYGRIIEMPLREDMVPLPSSPYGLQKWIGEHYAKLYSTCYGLETVSLRYFNVFGERQSQSPGNSQVMSIFSKAKREGKKLTITNDGNQRRDFVYVKDVVYANLLASASAHVGRGEVINIGSGENISLNQLADLFGGEREYIGKVDEPFETLANINLAMELLKWKPDMKLETWIERNKISLGIG